MVLDGDATFISDHSPRVKLLESRNGGWHSPPSDLGMSQPSAHRAVLHLVLTMGSEPHGVQVGQPCRPSFLAHLLLGSRNLGSGVWQVRRGTRSASLGWLQPFSKLEHMHGECPVCWKISNEEAAGG